MVERDVRRKNRIVRFHNRRRHLRRWINGELQFALLAVVDWQSLHQQRGKARAGPPSERVEDQEASISTNIMRQHIAKIGRKSNPVCNFIKSLTQKDTVFGHYQNQTEAYQALTAVD